MTTPDAQHDPRRGCICERVQHGYAFHTAECDAAPVSPATPDQHAAEEAP